MKAASIDLDAQKLFQPDIGKVNLAAKMIQQRELTRFVGRFESGPPEAESLGKAISERAVEFAFAIKQTYSFGRLAGFDDNLDGPGFQPPLALVYQFANRIAVKSTAMLFADFELNLEASAMRHPNDFTRTQVQVGEALAAFDPRDAYVGAEAS